MASRARGEGTYRTRKDGRTEWRGWVETPAGRVRKSVFGANKRACAARVLELRGKVARDELVVSERVTVKKFVEDWLARSKGRGLRFTTLRAYERLVNGAIVPALGHHRLSKLRRLHVVMFVESLTARGWGPRTVALAIYVLKAALNDAVAREQLTMNPALRVPLPKAQPAEPEPLAVEQIQSLLKAAAADVYGAVVIVAMTTGLRQGEILALRWEDVKLDAGTLDVRHTLAWIPKEDRWELTPPKSEAGRRNLTLPKTTSDALKAQSKVQKAAKLKAGKGWQDHGFVFTAADGRPLRPHDARRAYDRMLKAAGIPHRRFHATRHDAVGLLLEQGVPLKLVSEVIGHASIGITADTYGRLADRAKVQAADAMDRALGGQAGGQTPAGKQ